MGGGSSKKTRGDDGSNVGGAGGSVLAMEAVASVVPPGSCALTEEWAEAPLLERCVLTHDTVLLTFGLPDASKALGLPTCACILAKTTEEPSGEQIIRPYTPISTNALIGKFQLVIKVYAEGRMSRAMHDLPVGDTMHFKHVPGNVKIQYPFGKKAKLTILGAYLANGSERRFTCVC